MPECRQDRHAIYYATILSIMYGMVDCLTEKRCGENAVVCNPPGKKLDICNYLISQLHLFRSENVSMARIGGSDEHNIKGVSL